MNELIILQYSCTPHGTENRYVQLQCCILTEGICSEWFQVLNRVGQVCTVAPDLYLNPMDWILNRTIEQSPLGVSIGREHFTDLDYADDVALVAEMLKTLVAGLLVRYYRMKPHL